jgi:hypothetical protein
VKVLVHVAAAMQVHDLVDAVAELVAAVLDVHRRLRLRQVAAVHIGSA